METGIINTTSMSRKGYFSPLPSCGGCCLTSGILRGINHLLRTRACVWNWDWQILPTLLKDLKSHTNFRDLSNPICCPNWFLKSKCTHWHFSWLRITLWLNIFLALTPTSTLEAASFWRTHAVLTPELTPVLIELVRAVLHLAHRC